MDFEITTCLDDFDPPTCPDHVARLMGIAMIEACEAENAKRRSRIDADFDRWCDENGVGR